MADLTALLNEISSDNPCGEYLEYDAAYLELNKAILGKPEDPITGDKAEPPNWKDIQKQALAILQRSKDLQVAIYLLRALVNLEGIVGFYDGLNLLVGYLEKYWEHIHPILDPEDDLDPTTRVNILEELNNFNSVLWPLTLSPLVDSKAAGRFSLRDIHIATDQTEAPEDYVKPDINMINAAFLDVPDENLLATHKAIVDSVDLIQRLETFVAEKVGIQNGPDLNDLVSLLKEIRGVFQEYAASRLNAQDEDLEAVEGETDLDNPEAGHAPRKTGSITGINTRQDVLKALDYICKYYAEHEPSSPVPLLLKRAKLLVTSDFTQIVQNLVPDGLSQLELIKGPESETD